MVCATFRLKDIKTFCAILVGIVIVLGATCLTYKYLTKGVVKLSTYEDRVEYLTSLDISTDSMVETTKDVTIPTVFNDTYEQYASIQLEKGFPDLHTFSGENATVYNYSLNDGSNVQLLVCDGILVGTFLGSTQ
jgi:hypothetical protein